MNITPSAPNFEEAPLLEVCGLRKTFGKNTVLADVSFTVPRGGIVSILGRSGTGKSVLLKSIVGLLPLDAGRVLYRGKDTGNATTRDELRRDASYVFQTNAAFDSISTFENVLLPLRARGEGTPELWEKRAHQILERLELTDAAARFPAELSGGMLKRLAVARALVTEPEVVFFDEPTAGLDPVRRNAVFQMIVELQRERGFTAVLVTHDVPEALLVSSQVVWLDAGRVPFCGSPTEFEKSDQPGLCEIRDNLQSLRQSLQSFRNSPPSTPKTAFSV